jgi:EAL domain-containing protein (putative c-di-GMP-specific phosphodiesterase class I)
MDPNVPPPAASAGSPEVQAPADERSFSAKASPLPTYREHLEELKRRLAESGFLALLLIDVSDINRIERDYGSSVYEDLMKLVREVVFELKASDADPGSSRKGKQLRAGDVVALNERAGDVFLIFLMPRNAQEHLLAEDLEKIGNRIEAFLTRKISKTALPYLHHRPEISVGTSLALRNPLIREERLILKAIEESRQAAHVNRQRRQLADKQLLQRIILKGQIDTVFQPIMDLRSGRPHGFEALCRGPKGTPLETPMALFDVAEKADLLFELDLLCRRKALQAGGNLERQYKLFINALPFSMRDPSFQGKYLINLFEGTDLAPEQIVFEVTERLAIENYPLFVDAMQYFSDMRCLIAIDDMGAGYSGLEKIVHLRPNYVKLDMQLVRDIDTSFVKQQMLHAFRVMAEKIDARLIAEGVETREELETVREIGVDYVQGFLLAKPSAAFQLTPDIKL